MKKMFLCKYKTKALNFYIDSTVFQFFCTFYVRDDNQMGKHTPVNGNSHNLLKNEHFFLLKIHYH